MTYPKPTQKVIDGLFIAFDGYVPASGEREVFELARTWVHAVHAAYYSPFSIVR